MAVGILGPVRVNKVRLQPADESRHAPRIERIKREMAIGMERPQEVNRHALDLAIEVARRLVSLRNDFHVQSRLLLRERVVQNPATGMLLDATMLGVVAGNRNAPEMDDLHAGSSPHCFR